MNLAALSTPIARLPPAKAPPRDRGQLAEQILAVLAHGPAPARDIAQACSAQLATVKKRLTALKETGQVRMRRDQRPATRVFQAPLWELAA